MFLKTKCRFFPEILNISYFFIYLSSNNVEKLKYEFRIIPTMRKYSFNNNKIYGGPTDVIFGSDDGFALFLNGMGFSIYIYRREQYFTHLISKALQ